MALSRDQILTADDLPREEAPVPEWGGSVFVLTLNLVDMVALATAIKTAPPEEVLSVVLSYTIGDESGAKLFTPADVQALGRKNREVLSRLVEAAKRVNKLDDQAVDAAEGNSAASRNAS